MQSLCEMRNIHVRGQEAGFRVQESEDRGQTTDSGAMPYAPCALPLASSGAMPYAPCAMPTAARKVRRSPDEEFAARLSRAGLQARFPQSVIALILQKQKFITVTKTGINFEYQGSKYQYWHEHSQTCANDVEKRVLVSFDPDAMEFCHVLKDDGAYIESIPQKGKVAWFDDAAMKDAFRAKAQALNRDLARFQTIHQATSEAKAARIVRNADKMQMVNTFSCPTVPENRSGLLPSTRLRSAVPDRSPSFSRADAVANAAITLGEQRGRAKIALRTERQLADMAESAVDAAYKEREVFCT